MKKRKVLALVIAFVMIFAMMPTMAFAEDVLLIAPADGAATDTAAPAKSNDIVILGTSDVHCGLEENIGYAGLVAYKKALQEEYNYVTLVDAGDAIQGDVVGTLSNGEYLTEVMNEVGYDILVPGNHEFDYGMDQFLNKIVKMSKAPYVAANFVDKDGKPVFDAYKIIEYGETKVAYVGIATPETFVKSTPTYFQDANGNYIYGFSQGDNGKNLYKAVQTAVDAAKGAGADYVIAVAHLGDDATSTPYTSSEVIANTNGIDALMDGHAHQTFTKPVKNKDGKAVQVVATGTKLENIGKIVISEKGVVTVTNVTAAEASAKDADMEAFIKGIKDKYEVLVNQKVATTEVELKTHTDDDAIRLVRSQETNLGDLCADAYKEVLGADIAFVNGGGIRAELAKGDITYGDIIAVHPYGNMACVIEATGQEILDALELGASACGVGESGGFLQVAGLTYEINPFIKSTVVLNDMNEFVEVAGARKVSNVKVGGVDIDPEKVYTLASHNYMLKSGGDGYTMFKGNKVLQDEVMIDNQVLITYIQKNLSGKVGAQYAQPQGRITVLTADDVISPIVQKLEVAEYECKVKITSSKKNIKLTWNACEAEGVKYQVYRSTKSGSGYKRVKTTDKTSFTTSSGVKKGVKYYFKVRAVKEIDGANYYGHYSNKVNGKKG
ncbi:MAG: 5'-nucleotidase C-terminal domain-containing protein [Firmicutes bacterium]|nr:5'-nucleotidase C-terminal domain-containing protein [Bacillota bacterium]